MEPFQTPGANPEVVESMEHIVFDVESQSFQATFDSTRGSTYQAVAALVSTALGREPLDLTPVRYAIDTDELDEIVTEPSTGNGTSDSISFRYEGFEITVTSDEVIEAKPLVSA